MGITRRSLLSASLLLLLPKAAGAQETPAPKDTVLYFISPIDGASVRGAFDVRFGLKNMGVTHAGDPYPNSGHHHLLIDVDQPLDVKEPIPRDKNHLHFGAGETETRIELPPATTHCSWCLGMPSTTPSIPRWSRTRSRSPCFLSARTRSEQKKQGTEKKKEKVKRKKAGIVAGGDTNHLNISSLINSNGSNLFGSHTSIAAEATVT
jgi:hypothetical protein